jgi:hypothetical protein
MTAAGQVEVWSDDREQVAAAVLAGEKIRTIDYIYFQACQIPAKGKKAASVFAMTLAEFKEHEDSISDPRMPASLYLAKKAPLLNAACMSDDSIIRDTFAMVNTMVKEYEANKPAGSSPVRNVENYITSALANVFLIAAGISGEIPETLDIDKYLVKARAEAEDKATKLGVDGNGQFRLKAEKKAKTEEDTTEGAE